MMVTIREISKTDAEALLQLRRQLDAETSFMLLEPGERTTTVEDEHIRIAEILQKDNQMIFVAEHNNTLVGYLSAIGGGFRRNRHSAYIVIGILQAFVGQGIGAKLFTAMEHWARQQELHRLELTVMVHNERGVKLYQKMGFGIEGRKRDSLCVDGRYIDEYVMAKLL